MQHKGFTMNGEQDPVKRVKKLKERIGHLQVERDKLQDQIDIMLWEIRSIETTEWIDSLEFKKEITDVI